MARARDSSRWRPARWLLAATLIQVPGCLLDFNQFEVPDGGSGGALAGAGGDSPAGGRSGGGTSVGGGQTGGTAGDSGGGNGSGGRTSGGSGGLDSSGGGRASGGAGTGGDSGGTGTGGTGTGGSGGEQPGGAPGSGGDLSCGAGTKLCSDDCVPLDEPETGCAGVNCLACQAYPGGETICDAGACALGACHPGSYDCDGVESSGCEHSESTYSEFACGGCDADCTSLGLSNCQSGRCGCATNSECRGNANSDYDCSQRLCICGGTTCNVGERCGRDGNSAECRCGAEAACASGWTCCPTISGPSCKQLDGNDSSNCGACGIGCSLGQVCVGGICQ